MTTNNNPFKKLLFSSPMELIECNISMIITDAEKKILAVSIIDVDSSSRGLGAKIVTGNRDFYIKDPGLNSQQTRLGSLKSGSYQFWNATTGGQRKSSNKNGKSSMDVSTHTLVLSKRITMTKEQRDAKGIEGNTIILCPDGEIFSRFGRLLTTEFGIPYMDQWFRPLYKQFERENLIENLDVWSAKGAKWENLQAFSLSDQCSTDRVLEIVTRGIKAGVLVIPEGSTDAPAITDQMTDTSSYLTEMAPHLAAQLEDLAAPVLDLSGDIRLDPAIASMKRVPFPAQAIAIQAMAMGLKKQRAVFAIGDMGSGKSIKALGVVKVMWEKAKRNGKKGMDIFLLAPAVTLSKWEHDEIKKTIPEATVIHLSDWRDTVDLMNKVRKSNYEKKGGLKIYIMGRDTAKLGVKKFPTLNWGRISFVEDVEEERTYRLFDKEGNVVGSETHTHTKQIVRKTQQYGWLCADCGRPIVVESEDEETMKEDMPSWKDYAFGEEPTKAVRGDKITWRDMKKEIHCPHCDAKLSRFADPTKEKVSNLKRRRMEPAWLIKRYLKGYFSLAIIDELQSFKNESGQGVAMGSIVSAAKKTIALTGTLSDGKASSLFHILCRTDFASIKADGLNHRSLTRFIHRYGVVETTERYEGKEELNGGFTRAKKVEHREKELPGLNPLLFVNYLASKCVFLELGDLGLPLVKLSEEPIFIVPDHIDEYTRFHEDLYDTSLEALRAGNKTAFSKFVPSVVNYANQPHKDIVVTFDNDEFGPVIGEKLIDDNELSAKERQLVQDCKEEIAQGRRVIVYINYSGSYNQGGRLVDVLRQNGLKTEEMRTGRPSDPEDRVDWIENQRQKGVQVIVTNVQLVEVGVDLLAWPTLIFYQFTDKISTLRQASRRSWRIAQNKNCIVKYYAYSGTYEMQQFERMLGKRSHALLLEGRIDRSEIAKFVKEDSLQNKTVSIASCLGDVEDLASKWQELADKDIPDGVLQFDEAEFAVEIKKAMTRLANETRRLCGVPIVEDKPEVKPLSLFDAHYTERTETSAKPVEPTSVAQLGFDVFGTDSGSVAIMTDSEIRAKLGLVSKAKRVKKAVGAENVVIETAQLGFMF